MWPEGAAAPADLLDVLRGTFLPNRTLSGASEGAALDALARVVATARDRRAISGRATAYVCERGQCQAPAFDAPTLARQLAAARPLR